MTTRALSYALQLRGELDPSVQKVFGAVSRELQDTQGNLSRVTQKQQQLNRELREVKRGSDAYVRVQQEIEDTKREVSQLTATLNRQQSEWSELTDRSRKFGRVATVGITAIGGAIAGLVVGIDSAGLKAGELLSIFNATGLEIQFIQELQGKFALIGRDVDIGDFNEVSIRLGEINENARLAATGLKEFQNLATRPAEDALKAIGLDPARITTKDIPLIIESLKTIPRELRAFYTDEIFGGAFAENLVGVSALPQEAIESVEQYNKVTREQSEALVIARADLLGFKQELAFTGTTLASSFIPAMGDALETITPFIQGFAEFAENNPRVIQALGLIAGATVALTGVTWALNTALAIRAILTPGIGWAAAGVALAVLGGVGIYALTRGDSAADAEEAADDSSDKIAEKTGRAVKEGVMQGNINQKEIQGDFVDNILRTVDCKIADAVGGTEVGSGAAIAGAVQDGLNDEGFIGPKPIEAVAQPPRQTPTELLNQELDKAGFSGIAEGVLGGLATLPGVISGAGSFITDGSFSPGFNASVDAGADIGRAIDNTVIPTIERGFGQLLEANTAFYDALGTQTTRVFGVVAERSAAVNDFVGTPVDKVFDLFGWGGSNNDTVTTPDRIAPDVPEIVDRAPIMNRAQAIPEIVDRAPIMNIAQDVPTDMAPITFSPINNIDVAYSGFDKVKVTPENNFIPVSSSINTGDQSSKVDNSSSSNSKNVTINQTNTFNVTDADVADAAMDAADDAIRRFEEGR